MTLLQSIYNNIAPEMIRNVFEVNTQQPKPTKLRAVKERTFFILPKTTKKCFDNTIFVKGPKLYNKAATEFNRSLNDEKYKLNHPTEPQFQNKFTRPFKTMIKNNLINYQSDNDPNEWDIDNFALYR